jgi:hypothetical protein
MSKKKTAAEKRIATAPASAFRKLTKTELEKLGFSPKSERFIEVGKRIAKNVKTISKRLFTIKKTGLSPETAAKAHSEGELLYKSRSTQIAAEKQRKTRLRQKAERGEQRELKLADKRYRPLTAKQIDLENSFFAKRASALRYAQPGPNAIHPEPWLITRPISEQAISDHRRKLADPSDRLPDGRWHRMIDIARASNDPNIGRLLQSKNDKRSSANDGDSDNLDIDMDEA